MIVSSHQCLCTDPPLHPGCRRGFHRSSQGMLYVPSCKTSMLIWHTWSLLSPPLSHFWIEIQQASHFVETPLSQSPPWRLHCSSQTTVEQLMPVYPLTYWWTSDGRHLPCLLQLLGQERLLQSWPWNPRKQWHLPSTQSPLKSRELGQCPTTGNGNEYSGMMSLAWRLRQGAILLEA